MIKSNSKGFTLIELLTVILIIGILAMIAVPNLMKFKSKTGDAVVKQHLKDAMNIVHIYYADKLPDLNSAADLYSAGLKQDKDISLTIVYADPSFKKLEELAIKGKHVLSGKTHVISSDGSIDPGA